MKARSWDTGPPRSKNVDAAGGKSHGTCQSRRQPDPASENARLQLLSQVRVSRVPLVCLNLALSPEDWRWLRWQAERRAES